MRIAILGYDRQGRSAFKHWNKPENEITICDQNTVDNIPEGVKTNFGGDYLLDLDQYDLLIRTPGLHPRQILNANPEHPEILNRVTTVTNEFFKVCLSKNIIGVTGTKGKGTTSSLIAKILETAGHRVHLGGNIGIPPLDMLDGGILPTDWVVLELANYQLIDLQYSPKIAVCLMVAPEHLDWHTDMYEYIMSKERLFIHQKPEDLAVFNAHNLYSEDIAGVSSAKKIVYDVPPVDEVPQDTKGVYVEDDKIYAFGEKICGVDEVALLGRHNLENICAAIAATWGIIKHNKEVVRKVVRSFAGLPHRLEIVKKVKGVWYVNDSFASNPEATIAAIDAIPEQKVMLIGGYDRGIDQKELIQKIKITNTIRKIVLIGASGPRLSSEFKKARLDNFVITEAQTMKEVLAEAERYAKRGDAIVLSPGFASFDMFKDFEDRGIQFKQLVEKL